MQSMSAAEAAAGFDAALVETWITGWTMARETPPPRRVPGGFRVEVGWPDQRARIVFPALEGVAAAAAAIDEPWVWIKVCAAADAVRPLLPARWSIERIGFLMERLPAPFDASPPPRAYQLALEARESLCIAEVRHADGPVVASGRVALLGGDAVYDRIATEEAHRRRGLGRAVMTALGRAAEARGCTRGLLVGTLDGRALYQALGWRLLGGYTSAVIRPAGG
jgi:GNAT superfamily N-acetyltransferase